MSTQRAPRPDVEALINSFDPAGAYILQLESDRREMVEALRMSRRYGHHRYCPSKLREVECDCGYEAACAALPEFEDLAKHEATK